MSVHYDSLSEALLEEDEAWGELGESALASSTKVERQAPSDTGKP